MLFRGLDLDRAWYDAIRARTSRRTFDGAPAPGEALERLRAHARDFRPVDGVRIAIVDDAPADVFTGYAGSFGLITGAPTVAAFLGNDESHLGVGYAGEAFILEATRLSLDTCWVAGSFSRETAGRVFSAGENERVLSLTPLGKAVIRVPLGERSMRALVRASSRKPLSVLAPGAETGAWPTWARVAAEAARLAPTGGNGQPQRLRLEKEALVVSVAERAYWTAPIDLGIVMLHAELGAVHAGVRGVWEAAQAPDVARFVPTA